MSHRTIHQEKKTRRRADLQGSCRSKQEREKKEKKAAMLRSIAEHREAVQKELQCKKKKEKQDASEILNANKAADLLFLHNQKTKAQKRKEEAKQDFHVHQMSEKRAKVQLKKIQKQDEKMKNAQMNETTDIQGSRKRLGLAWIS
ncbi:hypothetical protein KOW79_012066 [Hemibagrus wyckioides]|uniref:Uncharacterized protein n=1 Tax=Hemibagrus wyckioides TaxID=337641 RepID=A0A9D3SHG5_9TELE|nr:hypothetical protein KOW79_012066 [Hemibagrus wyckioides]